MLNSRSSESQFALTFLSNVRVWSGAIEAYDNRLGNYKLGNNDSVRRIILENLPKNLLLFALVIISLRYASLPARRIFFLRIE